jgi:polyisoprenyl-phosphate glycosyltransferase
MLRSRKKQACEISVVSPVYMASGIVPELVRQINGCLLQMGVTYEIILVEDGSKDGSWQAIVHQCERYNCITAIKLSRNFGQHIAITAGLENARGKWIVVMDCDLQDQPSEIRELYKKALEGYDIVLGQRLQRNDGKVKRLSSSLFYRLFGYLTGTEQDPTVANFGIYRDKVISSIIQMGDNVRYFPAMVQWVGYRSTRIPVKHDPRLSGSSSYNIKKLLYLAANNIIAFSDKPLRLSVVCGFILATLSFLLGIAYFFMAVLGIFTVSGFATVAISIYFSTGAIIFVLGLVGLYVGKSFDKVKNRPLYIVEQSVMPNPYHES